MKNLSRLLVLFSAVAGTALWAQDNFPAPAVTAAPPPPPPAASTPTPVDGLIHVQKLPSAAQLTADAEAEGMTVTRMEQYPDRIIVSYRYASGNTRTFAYTTTLPEDPDSAIAAPPARPPSASVESAPAPNYTVIYPEPAPVYYYPRYYYDPFDSYWPRTSFSFGLGFGNTWGSGYRYSGRSHYGPSHHNHWRR